MNLFLHSACRQGRESRLQSYLGSMVEEHAKAADYTTSENRLAAQYANAHLEWVQGSYLGATVEHWGFDRRAIGQGPAGVEMLRRHGGKETRRDNKVTIETSVE